MRDAQGTITSWYLLLTDIEERKRAEEKLRRSEEFLAEGQRLTSTGSFSWKVATDEITWSEQLYRIYEFEIGVPLTLELIRTRVHPEDVSLIEKLKMVDQAGGSEDFECHWRLRMPDHSIKYLHAVAHASRDRDGQLEYIAAVQDVTARRLSEEAVARARSELARVARVTSLGVLTASIAHEVNQPLSGIITNASTCLRMLSADPPNVAGARETARRTIRDGNRASDVVSRLRTLYSKKNPQLELMDLNEAAREVTSLSLSELQRNRVSLRQELAADLPLVTGDRIELQQVIMNLLRNASDAMSTVDDRQREVLIRTERDEGDRVRLSVKDVGVGFPPQAMDKLFDAFFTTKNDGMGIGLSISHSIIEAHHGRLWATANEGPGATFSFSIPCRFKALAGAATRVGRTDPYARVAINACAEQERLRRTATSHPRPPCSRPAISGPSCPTSTATRTARRDPLVFRLVHLADIEAVTACLKLDVNAHRYVVDAPVGTTLAEALREELALTGTKVACGEGQCGACTVLVDGVPTLSCITLVHAVEGAAITTIEGFRDHAMVESFVRSDALQCGFCTPGQIVSAVGARRANPKPSSEEIRHAMAGNLCRCGAYPKIEEAIRTWRD